MESNTHIYTINKEDGLRKEIVNTIMRSKSDELSCLMRLDSNVAGNMPENANSDVIMENMPLNENIAKSFIADEIQISDKETNNIVNKLSDENHKESSDGNLKVDNYEVDNLVSDEKKKQVEVEIKMEDDDNIFRKFSFGSDRKRKQTQLYIADETCIRKRRPPPDKPVKKVKEERDNQCHECKRVFDNKKALFNHHNMFHKSEKAKIFKCIECNYYCEDNKQLKEHKECHKDNTYMCMKCKLAYDNHCLYWMHSINHLPKRKSYTCEECQKVLFDKKALKSHIKLHYNIYKTCKVCNESVNRTAMNAHTATHEQIQCVECGKICRGKRHHTEHMNTHIGFKPYQCLYCGKGFYYSAARNVHTNIHLGIKKFQCKLCPYKANQQTNLNRHMVKHDSVLSNKKSNECEICKKTFLHAYYLKKHMRIHTGKQLLKCPMCPKAFLSKTEVRSHVKYTHTKSPDQKCEVCNIKVMTKNQLLRHFKSAKHMQNQFAFDNKDKP